MAQSILKRIAEGEKAAVQDCMNTYGGLVWSLARKMMPIADEAEDAVQEVFIEIWKNAERFDETKSSETTFVAMLARRRIIDRLRKSNRQPQTNPIDDMVSEPSNTGEQDIKNSAEAGEAIEMMQELRPEQKQVLMLSIVHGFSHQEIADALDMPLGTVKTHARRGLIQAKEILEERREKTTGAQDATT